MPILTNAEIVLEDRVIRGALAFEDGTITEISETGTRASDGLDLGGDLLLPGLIELHTDNLERHMLPRPGVDWPHAAAILAHDGEFASVGVTTVFDAMRVGMIPFADGRDRSYARRLASELWDLRAREALRISHFLHLRAEICSESLVDELASFAPQDRVGIVSVMDHTPGYRQFRDLTKFKTHVQGRRYFSDAEFDAHVARLRAVRLANGARHEQVAASEAGRLGAVMASHDDTTPEHVAESAARKARFAEFPTTRAAAEACHARNIAVMMGAPNLMREGSHFGNVAARELAEAGLLDILSSDYVPSALMHAAFRLADLWGDLPRAVATVTAAPARATRLVDRGRLAPGLRADLVRVARFGGLPVIRGVWSNGRRVG